MGRRPGKLRTERVIVLYSTEEFEELRKLYARSTSRSFSSYVRKVSLEEPVGIVTRNGSFDAFVEEIVVLRKAMMTIYQEGQWSPANQERLVHIHEEIKIIVNKIAELCMPH